MWLHKSLSIVHMQRFCVAYNKLTHLQNPYVVWFLFVLAVEVTLKFTYVEKYPDESPLWEIASQENLEDSDTEVILTLLKEQVAWHLTHQRRIEKFHGDLLLYVHPMFSVLL